MNLRITSQSHAELIAGGIALLPGRLTDRLAHVAFFTEDPIAAGLHDVVETGDGRSFRAIAHHIDGNVLQRPRSEQRSTVVVRGIETRGVGLITVVHELGHSLHEAIGYSHTPRATTEYSSRNQWEAFAEAFTAWVLPPVNERAWRGWDEWEAEYETAKHQLRDDPATLRLFETLAYD